MGVKWCSFCCKGIPNPAEQWEVWQEMALSSPWFSFLVFHSWLGQVHSLCCHWPLVVLLGCGLSPDLPVPGCYAAESTPALQAKVLQQPEQHPSQCHAACSRIALPPNICMYALGIHLLYVCLSQTHVWPWQLWPVYQGSECTIDGAAQHTWSKTSACTAKPL